MTHLQRVLMVDALGGRAGWVVEREQTGNYDSGDPEAGKGSHGAEAAEPRQSQCLTSVTCATSMPCPRKPPSQYIR